LVSVDFKRLWEIVTEQFSLGINSIHGPRHWKQVEKNGSMFAEEIRSLDDLKAAMKEKRCGW
jgi:hypothetical protein